MHLPWHVFKFVQNSAPSVVPYFSSFFCLFFLPCADLRKRDFYFCIQWVTCKCEHKGNYANSKKSHKPKGKKASNCTTIKEWLNVFSSSLDVIFFFKKTLLSKSHGSWVNTYCRFELLNSVLNVLFLKQLSSKSI